MLKNKYHANVRMAAVLITLLRQLSSAVNESYWPCFFGCVSLVFCSSTHTRQLNKEDTVCGFRHCQREAGSETQPYQSSSIWKSLWVENFMTPGLMTIISTPRKQHKYVVAAYIASYPGPFEKSEKRAWYPLFAHALNFPTFREFRIIP